MFRNLIYFNLDEAFTLSAYQLEKKLEEKRLQPCSANQVRSVGFVGVREEADRLVEPEGKQMMICVGEETKTVPKQVIDRHVKERAALFEKERGFKAGRKQIRDFKDIVLQELLPHAFPKRKTVVAIIDPETRRLMVDASSDKNAELVHSTIRDVLGSFPVAMPECERTVANVFAEWFGAGNAPAPLDLLGDCELVGEGKKTVKLVRHELDCARVLERVADGLLPRKVALAIPDESTFTLDEGLRFTKFKPVVPEDIAEGSETADAGDPVAEFHAQMLLLIGRANGAIDAVEAAVGIEVESKQAGERESDSEEEHDSLPEAA